MTGPPAMNAMLRWLAGPAVSGRMSAAVRDLNARHPWSHNDHFHSWILANLPAQRRAALDVGCGQGALLAALSPLFDHVTGTDLDDGMRRQAGRRCAGLPNVSISGTELTKVEGQFDLVTMVAVLHHLPIEPALREVRRLLAPGGLFLAVGLALPRTALDHLWDVASALTNPVIGYVKHPWPAGGEPQPPSFPVAEPTLSFGQIRQHATGVMPGAVMRHRLGFRHTIAWTKSTGP